MRLGKLSSSIPVYFDFGFFLLLAMTSSFLIYSIYNMVVFSRDNWCGFDPAAGTQHRPYCGSAWKFYFSWANKNDFVFDITERLLYVANVVVLYSLRVFFLRKMRVLQNELDDKIVEATDFAVELRGLDPSITSEEEILNYFRNALCQSEELRNTIRVNPVAVNFVFSETDTLTKQDDKIRKLLKQYGKASIKNFADKKESIKADYLREVQMGEAMVEHHYTVARLPNQAEQYRASNFCGEAYVFFNTMLEQKAVLNQMAITGLPKLAYKMLEEVPDCMSGSTWGGWQKLNEKNGFFVLEPEHPADIIWQNQGISAKSRTLRGLLSIVLTMVIFCASFWTVYGLKQWQVSVKKSFLASTTLTLVLKGFNFLFSFLTKYMIEFEKSETRTKMEVKKAWRLVLFGFVNSVAVLFAINITTHGKDLVDLMWADSGLGNDLWFMLLFNLLDPFLSLINLDYIIKLYSRWKLDRVDNTQSSYTQKEANQVYEGVAFSHSSLISKHIRTVMLALFLLPLFPLSAAVAIFCLTFFYWNDKIFLLRFAKLPEYCSVEFGMEMLKFFDVAMIFYTVGS